MKNKYFIVHENDENVYLYKATPNGPELVATFTNENAGLAAKCCDLLNETSRSKGEYPRGSTTT